MDAMNTVDAVDSEWTHAMQLTQWTVAVDAVEWDTVVKMQWECSGVGMQWSECIYAVDAAGRPTQ